MKIEIETKYSIGDIVYAIHYGKYKKFIVEEVHSKVDTKRNNTYSTNSYTCRSIETFGVNEIDNNIMRDFEEYELMTKEKLQKYMDSILK